MPTLWWTGGLSLEKALKDSWLFNTMGMSFFLVYTGIFQKHLLIHFYLFNCFLVVLFCTMFCVFCTSTDVTLKLCNDNNHILNSILPWFQAHKSTGIYFENDIMARHNQRTIPCKQIRTFSSLHMDLNSMWSSDTTKMIEDMHSFYSLRTFGVNLGIALDASLLKVINSTFLFHVNQPSHSWDSAISKFNLENPRSRSWVLSKVEVT